MKYLYVHLKKYIFTACVLLIAASLLAPGAAADYGVDILARSAESIAAGKPFAVRVAVCAVMLNRVRAAGFPDTLPAVTAGLLASQPGGAAEYSACVPDGRSMRAAAAALRGGDPTRGALYFAESGDVPDDIRESGRILFEASGFAFWK